MVVPAQLDDGECEEREPDREGDPDPELGGEHLIKEVVCVNILLFVNRVAPNRVRTVLETLRDLLQVNQVSYWKC